MIYRARGQTLSASGIYESTALQMAPERENFSIQKSSIVNHQSKSDCQSG
jgi:hypothetical protein